MDNPGRGPIVSDMRLDRPRRVLGPNFVPVVTIFVSVAAMLTYGYVAFAAGPGVVPQVAAAEPGPAVAPEPVAASPTSTTSSSTTTTTTTTTSTPPAQLQPPEPPREQRHVVPETEIAPEAKQLAVDIAYWLTTYEASERPVDRLEALDPVAGVEHLLVASEPLTHSGSWSRGEVVYPQLGGLTADRVSVMVVVRQTVGSASGPETTVVRTLDIRLVRGDGGWRFDFLSSAGGSFDTVDDLTLAHAVASDPRIEMPDSARLDILEGRISTELLTLMAAIAEQTPYGISALATGHPHNVFETDRRSHHTVGRAMDIYRVGDHFVVDDRAPDSGTMRLFEWLFDRPDVTQVGGPWDIDGDPLTHRSFTNIVHQDHIHVAVGYVAYPGGQ